MVEKVTKKGNIVKLEIPDIETMPVERVRRGLYGQGITRGEIRRGVEKVKDLIKTKK